jgi:polyhydroxyalkanoate synthesis regulator phasin
MRITTGCDATKLLEELVEQILMGSHHPLLGLEAATNSVQALLGFAKIDQEEICESQESDLEIVLSEFKKTTKEMCSSSYPLD